LYVHICKVSTLYQAYQDAKANHGSSGLDGITFDWIEEYGVVKYLKGDKQGTEGEDIQTKT